MMISKTPIATTMGKIKIVVIIKTEKDNNETKCAA